MFKVKKKDTTATSTNCVLMSIDVILVSFFVNFGHISHRFLVIFIEQVNTTGNKIVSVQVSTELQLSFTKNSNLLQICYIRSTQNHIQFNMGFRQCCLCYFHNCYITLDLTIFHNNFSNERDYECQILLCRISFAFRHKNNSLP